MDGMIITSRGDDIAMRVSSIRLVLEAGGYDVPACWVCGKLVCGTVEGILDKIEEIESK